MNDLATMIVETTTLAGLNSTAYTFQNVTAMPLKHRPSIFIINLIRTCYVIGVIGNLAAIIALRRGERRMRNRKHLLMLTTLATNDLVALLGMLAMMITSENLPMVLETKWFCALRVVMRIFGIGSVCITVTMALERWLALTQPFLYQKHITYYVIRTGLLSSWLWAAALTCMPLVGLGLYYDETNNKCTRYRNAETKTDIIYAIFYVIFGTLLCVILVYCNLAVIRALYSMSAPKSQDRLAVRRFSRHSSRRPAAAATSAPFPGYNTATLEEIAFSRLMATLSVLFMLCWLPQMITSSLYLGSPQSSWRRLDTLGALADLLMLLNYTLDPYLYVLLRGNRYSFRNCLDSICGNGKCWQGHKTSTESIKTSSGPQESLIVSEHPASELKALPPIKLSNASHDSNSSYADKKNDINFML